MLDVWIVPMLALTGELGALKAIDHCIIFKSSAELELNVTLWKEPRCGNVFGLEELVLHTCLHTPVSTTILIIILDC